MENRKTLYYLYRKRFNRLIANGKAETQEAAALFYFLNRTGYNGLCRFNRDGLFNVPFGRHTRINYTEDFSGYKERFAEWQFENRDFQALKLRPSDFVYADPPYDVKFTNYAGEGFSWRDQVRVGEWLARHPGPVVLSNQATKRIVALYRDLGFTLRYLDAPRLISCNGDRTPAREVLATKNF